MTVKVEITTIGMTFPSTARAGEPVHALGPIDAKISESEFVAFVGPSGCGKSTLLRLVAGLQSPSAGSVTVDGAIVSEPHPSRGMVFQQFALFPWLTLADNIGFALKGQLPDRERADRVGRLIEDVGLTGFGEHYPATLSGGMQQRAALARALAPDPEILLLDEPFGALDQQTRGLMQEMLAELWRAHRKTVLLVTHDIDEAIFLADRVLVMTARPGRIKREVEIDLPRPRRFADRTSTRFTELKREIGDALRDENLQFRGV